MVENVLKLNLMGEDGGFQHRRISCVVRPEANCLTQNLMESLLSRVHAVLLAALTVPSSPTTRKAPLNHSYIY
jgi:hypothetical protein